jgi:hypothetical protein
MNSKYQTRGTKPITFLRIELPRQNQNRRKAQINKFGSITLHMFQKCQKSYGRCKRIYSNGKTMIQPIPTTWKTDEFWFVQNWSEISKFLMEQFRSWVLTNDSTDFKMMLIPRITRWKAKFMNFGTNNSHIKGSFQRHAL